MRYFIFLNVMFEYLKDLKNLNKEIEKRDFKRDETYNQMFNEAISSLKKFGLSNNYEKEDLKQAAYKLIKSIEQKRSNAEAYICLSCIFYMLGDIKTAIKYFKVAQSLEPNHNKITDLQTILSEGNVEEAPNKNEINKISLES